jgi:hypothetical protein
MTEIAQTSYARENELLLLCARSQMRQEHQEKVTRLTQEHLDWVYLLAMAAQHGILPLLFQNLSACYDVIPHLYLGQLRAFYMTNSMRNQFLAKELITLQRDFKIQGIFTIPFKGPALAVLAYGDLSLREFVDLDILVHQTQLSQAFDVLKDKGFLLKGNDREEDQAHSPHRKTYTFTRGKGLAEIRIDLQSSIIGPHFSFQIDDTTVLSRVNEIPLAEGWVPSLAVEDLLIILCIHGSKHLWEKTKWICDIAELMQRHQNTLNWNVVTEQATRFGCRKMLELGLHIAQYLEHTGDSKKAFSRNTCNRLQTTDTAIPALALRISNRLFSRVEMEKDEKNHEAAAFCANLQDNFPDQYRYYYSLCYLQLPSKYWCLLPHHRLFALFYMFVVPIRKFAKYGLRSQHLRRSIRRWLQLERQ